MVTTESCAYAFCNPCGQYVYRIPGHRHGDGQIDSDESPVWLLADEQQMQEARVDAETLPHVQCGC